MTAGWYKKRSAYPLPPLSTTAVSPYLKNKIDIRWDSPASRHENEGWIIRGVNIYRSSASDRGPFNRVNLVPVGGTFFRDEGRTQTIHNEVVDHWLSFGDQAEDPYRFLTKHPISSSTEIGSPSVSPSDVVVTVNGQVAPVHRVIGEMGQVSLLEYFQANPVAAKFESNPMITEGSEVLISYIAYFPSDKLRAGVNKRDYYRVTTVAEDPATGELYETPLEHCPPFSDREIEVVDYMWREGTRRNNWILDQGGERVKLFIRKVTGEPCMCGDFDRETLIYAKQPDSICKGCFGTGIRGGYDGPYDIIVGPDEGEQAITQESQGRRKTHNYSVWIGPTPVVGQRDFIVKQNNDRYSIGPVTLSSNRGNILHQSFNIAYLDSTDIRYSVPILGVPVTWGEVNYSYNPTRDTYDARHDARYPVTPDSAYPMGSGRADKYQELKGRTGTFQNHNS